MGGVAAALDYLSSPRSYGMKIGVSPERRNAKSQPADREYVPVKVHLCLKIFRALVFT